MHVILNSAVEMGRTYSSACHVGLQALAIELPTPQSRYQKTPAEFVPVLAKAAPEIFLRLLLGDGG